SRTRFVLLLTTLLTRQRSALDFGHGYGSWSFLLANPPGSYPEETGPAALACNGKPRQSTFLQGGSAMSNSKFSPKPSPFQKASVRACFWSSQVVTKAQRARSAWALCCTRLWKKSLPVVAAVPTTRSRNACSACLLSVTSIETPTNCTNSPDEPK